MDEKQLNFSARLTAATTIYYIAERAAPDIEHALHTLGTIHFCANLKQATSCWKWFTTPADRGRWCIVPFTGTSGKPVEVTDEQGRDVQDVGADSTAVLPEGEHDAPTTARGGAGFER